MGLIPTSGYRGIVKYSKLAMMCFVCKEKCGGREILYGRNVREYRLPELPRINMDSIYAVTRTVYQFLWCCNHCHTCLHFRDVITMNWDTLAEKFKYAITGIEEVERADIKV